MAENHDTRIASARQRPPIVERVARAIYDMPGPDGDHIAAYLSDNFRISATNVEELRAEVLDICRHAAAAAIEECAKLCDEHAETYRKEGVTASATEAFMWMAAACQALADDLRDEESEHG